MEYKDAGIENPQEFYKTKFAFHEKYDFTHDFLSWYHIDTFKRIWLYNNIKPYSRVLDFGCGSGALSCLKRKGCYLTGIDYSQEGVDLAQSLNGYDQGFVGTIFDYDQSEYGTYDYIVSLDVFGHITFSDKDPIISELKKYLKKDGCMLHGIECGPVDYDHMTQEELKNFVEVDGHIGMESRPENENRFKQFFQYVDSALRFDCLSSLAELQKQVDQYHFDMNLQQIPYNYLKTLSEKEVKSYQIALGLTMRSMFNAEIPSNDQNGGFLFLRASNAPLEKLFIHTDLNLVDQQPTIYNENFFVNGWYSVECAEEYGEFRWMQEEGVLAIPETFGGKTLSFQLGTFNPRVSSREKACHIHMENLSNGTRTNHIVTADQFPSFSIPLENKPLLLKLYAEDYFIPGFLANNSDKRKLSIFLFHFSLQ